MEVSGPDQHRHCVNREPFDTPVTLVTRPIITCVSIVSARCKQSSFSWRQMPRLAGLNSWKELRRKAAVDLFLTDSEIRD